MTDELRWIDEDQPTRTVTFEVVHRELDPAMPGGDQSVFSAWVGGRWVPCRIAQDGVLELLPLGHTRICSLKEPEPR